MIEKPARVWIQDSEFGSQLMIAADHKSDVLCEVEYIKADLSEDNEKIKKAIELAVKFGGIDGEHHKDWTVDQMVRILAGDNYDKVVAEAKSGEDGPDTYEWNVGIAP